MAQATKEQVEQLETEHKRLFIALLQAALLRLSFARKYGLKSAQFLDYNKIYVPLVVRWWMRQLELEKSGGVPKFEWKYPSQDGAIPSDFWFSDGLDNLKRIAADWDKEGKGIGFIPLLIWAVVAIIGFFTAEKITDHLTSTQRDQAALIKQTDEFCTAHNLSPAECQNALQQQTTATASSGMSSYILPVLGVSAAAYLAYEFLIKPSHKKQAA